MSDTQGPNLIVFGNGWASVASTAKDASAKLNGDNYLRYFGHRGLSGKASENLQKFDMKERTMSNFYDRHLPTYLTIQDNKVMCKHLHLILNKNPPFTVV